MKVQILIYESNIMMRKQDSHATMRSNISVLFYLCHLYTCSFVLNGSLFMVTSLLEMKTIN